MPISSLLLYYMFVESENHVEYLDPLQITINMKCMLIF